MYGAEPVWQVLDGLSFRYLHGRPSLDPRGAPYMTRLVAFDVETVEILSDGTKKASAEFYRKEFRVDSCAFTERLADGSIKSWFVQGEEAVRAELENLEGVPLIAHNAPFELGVSRCRFPDLNVNIVADTMRLVQVYDNAGDENDVELVHVEGTEDQDEDVKKIPTSGLGLVKACRRILGEPDHKDEAYSWLRANGVRKGQEGANLHLLPPDILERYNTNDTEATLRLYEFITQYFDVINYNWRVDHQLYFSTVSHIVDAKIRGVLVLRDRLAEYAFQVAKEIDQIAVEFRTRFADEIRQVERRRLLEQIRSKKTLKGRKKYVKRVRADAQKWQKDVAFNVGSNKQLEALFVGVMQIQPKFFTAKGAPSFKSSALGQWGEGGLMLGKRRKRLLVLKQAEALLAVSEHDGRWHIDLKAAGTSSGRFAGGSH